MRPELYKNDGQWWFKYRIQEYTSVKQLQRSIMYMGLDGNIFLKI